ncbi:MULTISPECIES: ethanolamine utilization protein EutJ [unclassified Luteococcus]|uniref:ethanolamine utilization protein EutJ n=1 Tax=unclassified Luteococcus TaxID=2639923 RepID=UPI00313C38FF
MPTAPSPDRVTKRFATLVKRGTVASAEGPLALGVDLGTANIVLSVVDGRDRPVAGAQLRSTVVRDGIVVDWLGAVRAVRQLREVLEDRLGHHFQDASVSIPPAVGEDTTTIFRNVLEAAGLEVREVVDEPVAAARVLGLRDGAVIDVGHGTTGVSVLRDGAVALSVDEATGGHHMTLVLAGALGLDYDAAEKYKKSPAKAQEVFALVRPTLEKMATIARRAVEGQDVPVIHLVGGASSFAGAPELFAQVIGQPVMGAAEPLYVTPLGTAMAPREGGGR